MNESPLVMDEWSHLVIRLSTNIHYEKDSEIQHKYQNLQNIITGMYIWYHDSRLNNQLENLKSVNKTKTKKNTENENNNNKPSNNIERPREFCDDVALSFD